MQGWIKLHRQIRGHAFFKQKRKFSRFEAWVDMLLEANHCDKKFLLGNKLEDVERGSFVTSEAKLASRWGWSRTKVRMFLDLLINDSMIEKISDNKKTVINIANYDIYQDSETAKEPQKNIKKTSKKHQKNTTKNVKNVKNEKNVKKVQYAEFVLMTEEEHQKLIERFGEAAVNRMIEILDNYKGAKGKTYKSDYRAILNWVVKRYEEEEGCEPNGRPQKPKDLAGKYRKFVS